MFRRFEYHNYTIKTIHLFILNFETFFTQFIQKKFRFGNHCFTILCCLSTIFLQIMLLKWFHFSLTDEYVGIAGQAIMAAFEAK